MIIRYRCEFVFKGQQRFVTSENGISEFKDGFWLNDNLNITKGFDCRFWIPPHHIDYIAKDTVNI